MSVSSCRGRGCLCLLVSGGLCSAVETAGGGGCRRCHPLCVAGGGEVDSLDSARAASTLCWLFLSPLPPSPPFLPSFLPLFLPPSPHSALFLSFPSLPHPSSSSLPLYLTFSTSFTLSPASLTCPLPSPPFSFPLPFLLLPSL